MRKLAVALMLWVIKETYNNISVEIEEEKHKAVSVGGVQSLSPWGNSEWTNNSHTIISLSLERDYIVTLILTSISRDM